MLCVASTRPPPPSHPDKVHRIKRQQVVRRSPCNGEHRLDGVDGLWPTSFTVPTTHVWSLRVADADQPHMVLFHDARDAAAVMRALASFNRIERRLPDHYNDLRALFTEHFLEAKPVAPRGRPAKTALSTEEVDFEAVVRWTAARRIGLVIISKIARENREMTVPTTTFTPILDMSDDEAAEAAFAAVREDFGWQMASLSSPGEGLA